MARKKIHWNKTSITCYLNNMICNNCINKEMCNSLASTNMYGMKNMKYAVLKLIEQIGIPQRSDYERCNKK